MAQLVSHEFYCTRCGNRGLNVWRKQSSHRGKGHLKKLYCVHCGMEVNHYECYDNRDIKKFLRKYNNGDFLVQESNDVNIAANSSKYF